MPKQDGATKVGSTEDDEVEKAKVETAVELIMKMFPQVNKEQLTAFVRKEKLTEKTDNEKFDIVIRQFL